MSYTPTQQDLLQVLADGKSHHREELRKCLPDPLGNYGNLNVHLTYLRRQLPPGQVILCELVRRQIHYRHARLLGSPNTGAT